MTWQKKKTIEAPVWQEWRQAVTTCLEPFDLMNVAAAWNDALAQQGRLPTRMINRRAVIGMLREQVQAGRAADICDPVGPMWVGAHAVAQLDPRDYRVLTRCPAYHEYEGRWQYDWTSKKMVLVPGNA
jgi:hypothetical protein